MTTCWKCADSDAAYQAKCTAPACGMRETAEPSTSQPVGYVACNAVEMLKDEGGWAKILGKADETFSQPLYATPQAEPSTSPATLPVNWAAMIHYPECWDTAAYPELRNAIHEALAWAGCSVCKPEAAPSTSPDWEPLQAWWKSGNEDYEILRTIVSKMLIAHGIALPPPAK